MCVDPNIPPPPSRVTRRGVLAGAAVLAGGAALTGTAAGTASAADGARTHQSRPPRGAP